jgi:putative membrane protein insertion efficiency factor
MSWSQRRALAWIEAYQRAFAGRPSPCRFFPTCSSYAHEAFEVHGTRRGGWLTLRRLVRCRPLGPSGFDPVPEFTPSVRVGTPGDHLMVAPPTREVD